MLTLRILAFIHLIKKTWGIYIRHITTQNIIMTNKLRTVINVYIYANRLFLCVVMPVNLILITAEIALILTWPRPVLSKNKHGKVKIR